MQHEQTENDIAAKLSAAQQQLEARFREMQADDAQRKRQITTETMLKQVADETLKRQLFEDAVNTIVDAKIKALLNSGVLVKTAELHDMTIMIQQQNKIIAQLQWNSALLLGRIDEISNNDKD